MEEVLVLDGCWARGIGAESAPPCGEVFDYESGFGEDEVVHCDDRGFAERVDLYEEEMDGLALVEEE